MRRPQSKFTPLAIHLAVVVVLLAGLAGSASAAAGDLDLTFGSPNGFVTTNISGDDAAYAVAVQADGKIVAAGYSSYGGITARDFTLARYTAAGLPDGSFGLGGKVVTSVAAGNLNDIIHAIVVQADGNIVVAGSVAVGSGKTDFGLARYLSATGNLDPSFGSGGIVITSLSANDDVANALAIDGNGKIVAAGTANGNFAVVRYNANGTPDTTFNGSGIVTTDFGGVDIANAVVIQPADGKIILGGQKNGTATNEDFAVARYTAAGLLDTTFNGTGTVTTNFSLHSREFIEGLALQSTGKIVAVGYTNSNASDFALARYTSSGTLDGTFGGTGFFATNIGADVDEAHAVKVLANDKLLVAGFSNQGAPRLNDFALARYTPDGTLDPAFGAGGIVTTTLTATSDDLGQALAIQTDHNIVVAGSSDAGLGAGLDFAVARYQAPNAPPTLSGLVKSGLEDVVVTFSAADFTAHYADSDLDPLAKIKVTSLPAHGVLQVNNVAVTLNQEIQAGALSGLAFTPDPNWNGASAFNWNASDGAAYATADASVALTLTPVNDPPAFTKGGDPIVLKDSGAQTFVNWASNILAGPPDEITQTLTFSVTNNNHPLFSVQPAIDAAGTLSFTSAPAASGAASVTVTLTDNGGTANGGSNSSGQQTFNILIVGFRLFLPMIAR